MKFDLPEPLDPIRTLIGPSGSFSIDAKLLKPLTVMWPSALEDSARQGDPGRRFN